MNKFPEWTPASEPPIESGRYLVTAADGIVRECDYMDTHSWWKSNVHTDEHVIAWMPLPPAYNPPKFGWHNPQIDAPKRSGEYLVRLGNGGKHWSDVQSYNRDTNKWSTCATPLWWSHIEPTPEAHNET